MALTKAQLMELLKDVADDDFVAIRCDGGDYWGHYIASPVVKVVDSQMNEDAGYLGHPGGHTERLLEGKRLAILSEI